MTSRQLRSVATRLLKRASWEHRQARKCRMQGEKTDAVKHEQHARDCALAARYLEKQGQATKQ